MGQHDILLVLRQRRLSGDDHYYKNSHILKLFHENNENIICRQQLNRCIMKLLRAGFVEMKEPSFPQDFTDWVRAYRYRLTSKDLKDYRQYHNNLKYK